MAKQKKKNLIKKRYPPLSATDKFIYNALTFISLAGVIAYTYERIKLPTKHFLSEENVLAATPSSALWAIAPFAFALLVCFGKFGELSKTGKYPIFGNKNINYYNDKYLFTLPRFDKRYNHKLYKYRNVFPKSAKNKLISAVVTVVVCYLISLFGIFGRSELKTNSIEIYNCLNNLKKEYSYSSVVSYEIGSDSGHGGKYYTPPSIYIYLTMSDGETLSFDNSDFGYNYSAMQDVTERLVNAEKSVDGRYLDEFMNHYSHTDDEIRIINQLFTETER
ncbi:MAG: hypothetical protein NC110_04320 [Ruminococcus sp.]|nr:hypothetical protein [Ruminococcus sp.]